MFGLTMGMGALPPYAKTKLYLHMFGNTTAVNPTTGERELVDEGSASNNATMHGGQSFEGQAITHFTPNVVIDVLNPGTILFKYEFTGEYNNFVGNFRFQRDIRFGEHGSEVSGVFNGFSLVTTKTAIGTAAGKQEDVLLEWDGVSEASWYVKDLATPMSTGTYYPEPHIEGMTLLGAKVNNVFDVAKSHHGMSGDYYYIPTKLTQADKVAHSINPARTLYWSTATEQEAIDWLQHDDWLANGVILKSDLASITPAVIAVMQAGGGYWYPICENANCVSTAGVHYAVNACLPVDKTNVHTSSLLYVESGMQTLSYSHATRTATFTFLQGSVATLSYRPAINLYNSGGTAGDLIYVEMELTVETYTVFAGIGYEAGTYVITRLGVLDSGLRFFFTFDGVTVDTSVERVATIKVTQFYNLTANLTAIIGMTNTSHRLNAQGSPFTLQMPLISCNGLGHPDGLANQNEMNWDGKSYADLGSREIVGDFEMDVYIGAYVPTATNAIRYLLEASCRNEAGDYIGFFHILRKQDGSSQVEFGGTYGWLGVRHDPHIMTLVRSGDVLTVRINDSVVRVITYASYSVMLEFFGQSSSALNRENSITGSFRVIDSIRDAAKRTSDINDLKVLHGVA